MRRLALPALVLLALAAWWFLPGGDPDLPPARPVASGARPEGRSVELSRVRQTLDRARLDAFVVEQQRRVDADPGAAEEWRVLAEACIERALLADVRLGLAVGRPNRDALPEEVRADVERGMAASDRALALGDDTSEAWRVRCALLSRQIVGLGSFLEHSGAVDDAIERAAALAPDNPRVHVALGCRKLFAPRMLGHDPAGSLEHLLAAADALPHDERPLIYAAFACWLLEDRARALELARRALERTPAHPFARALVRRLEAGDEQPFRDLDP